MIGFITDMLLYSTHWVLSKTLSGLYNGGYYMLYGNNQNTLEYKIDELEKKIDLNENSLKIFRSSNYEHYLNVRNKYSSNTWLVIYKQEVIYDSPNLSDSIKYLSLKQLSTYKKEYLLIQKDNESNLYMF